MQTRSPVKPAADRAVDATDDAVRSEPSVQKRRRPTETGWSPLRLGAYRIAVLGAIMGAWQFASTQGVVDPDFVPPPSRVYAWLSAAASDGTMYTNLGATALAMCLAFVLGGGAGILVGALFGRYQRTSALLLPFILFFNALPRVALAPLFILYLGITIWSKVAVGMSIVFFVLLLNTLAGMRSVSDDHIKLARLYRFSEREIFWKISLPTAVPAIFAGLKLSAVYALLGVIVSEMIASRSGLGQLIIFNTNTFNLAGVYGTLFILAMMAMTLTVIMNYSERKLLAWKNPDVTS